MDKRIIFVLIILVAIIGIFFSLTDGFNFEKSNTEYTYDFEGVKFNIPDTFIEDTEYEKSYADVGGYDDSSDLKVFSDRNGENSVFIFITDKNNSQAKNIKEYSESIGKYITSKSVNGKNCIVVDGDGPKVYCYESNAKFVEVFSENETLVNEIIV